LAAPCSQNQQRQRSFHERDRAACCASRENLRLWRTKDETKDSLKAAPGFSYDRTSTTWKPAK